MRATRIQLLRGSTFDKYVMLTKGSLSKVEFLQWQGQQCCRRVFKSPHHLPPWQHAKVPARTAALIFKVGFQPLRGPCVARIGIELIFASDAVVKNVKIGNGRLKCTALQLDSRAQVTHLAASIVIRRSDTIHHLLVVSHVPAQGVQL